MNLRIREGFVDTEGKEQACISFMVTSENFNTQLLCGKDLHVFTLCLKKDCKTNIILLTGNTVSQGDSHISKTGKLVLSLRGVTSEFWFHLFTTERQNF